MATHGWMAWLIKRTRVDVLLLPRRPPVRTIEELKKKYFIKQTGKRCGRADRVIIYGEAAFLRDVLQAFALLKSNYPFGYSMVQRYIPAIEESPRSKGPFVAAGVRYETATPSGRLQVEPARYAALLVRLATELRCLLYFSIPHSDKFELVGLRMDLKAMRKMQCGPRYFHRILNQILTLEKRVARTNRR